MKHLPNILTGGRIILTLLMFLAVILSVGGVPFLSDLLTPDQQFSLQKFAVIAFFVAGITDFFDGWLARKLNATSLWGAILDPIGDKVLVCGAVLSLMAMNVAASAYLPCALILFREFTVSALREVSAAKGVSLPVTLLAKWKTTLQIASIGFELVIVSWLAFGLPAEWQAGATIMADSLLWIAAIVTVITGAQYWEAAREKLMDI